MQLLCACSAVSQAHPLVVGVCEVEVGLLVVVALVSMLQVAEQHRSVVCCDMEPGYPLTKGLLKPGGGLSGG